MKPGEIQTRLSQTNRWWRSDDWQREDPDLRAAAAAPFDYQPGVLRDLTPGGLYLLRGPRRVGKSTEVKRAIADLLHTGISARRIVHVSVDGWQARDLRTLVSAARATFTATKTQDRYWFIDEITSVAGDWPNEIKWLRDNDAGFRTDTVVLTGSSSARLDEATKALAGRRGNATNTDRTLLPMSFTAFCAASGLSGLPVQPAVFLQDLHTPTAQAMIGELSAWLHDVVTTWETYLRVGGFPEAVASWHQTGEVAPSFIEALWHVIHGEAITSARFAPVQTQTLLAKLAANLCSPLNITHLARDVDVVPATASARLEDLRRTFLIWPALQEQGLLPKLGSRPKYYFTDPLLARLACMLGYGKEPDLTQLSQQQVGLALLRAMESQAPGSFGFPGRLLYYRSASRSEIDFVGRDLGQVAVESKYVDDRWGRELQTITASPWFGILATRSGIEFGEHAWAVPAPILALILGA